MQDRKDAEFVGEDAVRAKEDEVSFEEYVELARLVDADLGGDDVEFAAFSSLCPTMREGEFDEGACAVFVRLRDLGMIEGQSDGKAFYFTGLTSKGREFVVERRESEKCAFATEGEKIAAAPEGAEEGRAGRARNAACVLRSFLLAEKSGVVFAVALCAAVGFLAGIAGGAIVACIALL